MLLLAALMRVECNGGLRAYRRLPFCKRGTTNVIA